MISNPLCIVFLRGIFSNRGREVVVFAMKEIRKEFQLDFSFTSSKASLPIYLSSTNSLSLTVVIEPFELLLHSTIALEVLRVTTMFLEVLPRGKYNHFSTVLKYIYIFIYSSS